MSPDLQETNTLPPPPAVAVPPAPAVGVEATLLTLRARFAAQLANDDEITPEQRIQRGRVRHRFDQVNIALDQLHAGTYGTCTDCQKPIEGERLDLLPFATRCISCQTVAEWRGFSY
jgi:RNA polymerase-binding transcription factor DksA